ncbi:hypothetical protein CNR22_16615 [Sphingobacteriaceae bacterium]|nr:hypothetical protein CNR22_16615 [Sphingobacteriaceae bacterium]
MRVLLALLLVVSIAELTFAQKSPIAPGTRQQKIDSLTAELRKDSAFIFRPKYSKPYLRVENRYSFISKEPVNLAGFMAGITLVEKHILCAGYYTLNRLTQKSIELTDENNITRREYLILNYFITSYQYVLVNKRYLQVNAPVEIGYGLYSTRTTDNLDNYLKKSSGNIIPASAGLQFIFKPVKWAGVSCIGGYRHVIQQKNIDLHFKGFYYSFGLWIDARHVIRHTKYYFKKREYRQSLEKI